MSERYFRLVVGETRWSKRWRSFRSRPLFHDGRWSVEPPTGNPARRFLSWVTRKPRDSYKMRLALWLELSEYNRQGVRVALRFRGLPGVEKCELVSSPILASTFSHRTDDGIVTHIQLWRDSIVYPTANYLGVLELRWSEKPPDAEFSIEYKLFSLNDEVSGGTLEGTAFAL